MSIAPTSVVSKKGCSDAPPPYTPIAVALPAATDAEGAGRRSASQDVPDDILHFLDHDHDTIGSLSLRYNVPAVILRRTNKITSDHLLLARRTVLIPGEYTKGGVSLSPRPVEGEEEELRKSKIRRFMIGCKVSEYDVALLYLEEACYDLPTAIETYFDDEAWEKANPVRKPGHAGKSRACPPDRPSWKNLFPR
jgi:hypothetical protein